MEAGHLINYDFKAIVQERSEVKRKMSQVEYNTHRANAIKSSCDALKMESKVAIEDLIKAAQEERKKETTKDANKDRLKDETAARIHYSLQKGELPTIVTGTRKSPEETPIFENELQALSQGTRDKLSKLQQIQDTIVKVKDEETRVREELNQFIIEAEKEHGPLANKFVMLDNKYKVLADLELELMDIRDKGNVITYERTGQAPDL